MTPGQHYHQQLTSTSACPDYHPYALTYQPSALTLQGFSFHYFGKHTRAQRDWLELRTAPGDIKVRHADRMESIEQSISKTKPYQRCLSNIAWIEAET